MPPMRRTWILSGLVLFATQPALAGDKPAGHEPAKREPCTIVRVVDGDTVDVKLRDGKVERTRLLAIDTEESYNSTAKPATPFGKQTSKWAKSYLTEGDDCELEFGPERRDVWDRLLCYLWVNGELYNLTTVKKGYSPYFTKYGFSQTHHEEFVAAEKAAREKGLGIWDSSRSRNELRGDYQELKAWWDERGRVLEEFDKNYARRGDIFAPRRGDYRMLKSRIGHRVTVFTAIRSSDEESNFFVGKAEGALYEPLAIVGSLSRSDVTDALKESVGKYRYFSGKLLEDVEGKPRLLITSTTDIATEPPKRQSKADL